MRFSCIKKFALSGTVLCALVNAKCQADTQNNVTYLMEELNQHVGTGQSWKFNCRKIIEEVEGQSASQQKDNGSTIVNIPGSIQLNNNMDSFFILLGFVLGKCASLLEVQEKSYYTIFSSIQSLTSASKKDNRIFTHSDLHDNFNNMILDNINNAPHAIKFHYPSVIETIKEEMLARNHSPISEDDIDKMLLKHFIATDEITVSHGGIDVEGKNISYTREHKFPAPYRFENLIIARIADYLGVTALSTSRFCLTKSGEYTTLCDIIKFDSESPRGKPRGITST